MMAARYLKAKTSDLFAPGKLQFEKTTVTEKVCMVAEDKALYTVHPAKKRLA